MAISFSYQNYDKYSELHNRNNRIILRKVKEFQIVNNLSTKDFIIGGSSCASFMDYFILKHVNDVDIFTDIDAENITKTSSIDIVDKCFGPQGYKDRAIKKDEFYFLAPEDLLAHECAAALVKFKVNNIEYIGQLLRYLNLTVDEYIPVFTEIINASNYFSEERKNLILRRIYLLRKWHGSIKKQ